MRGLAPQTREEDLFVPIEKQRRRRLKQALVVQRLPQRPAGLPIPQLHGALAIRLTIFAADDLAIETKLRPENVLVMLQGNPQVAAQIDLIEPEPVGLA